MEKIDNELTIYNEYKIIAAELVKSDLIPKAFKRPQDAWYAILKGRELGLSPIYSLDNISVTNGKTALSADAMLAICRRSPEYGGMTVDDTDDRCIVEIKRIMANGTVDIRRVSFTMDDAKKAGLLNKDNWKNYPKRMLRARATAYACKDLFSDILAGIYTPDEVESFGGKTEQSNNPVKVEFEVVEPAPVVADKPKPVSIEIAQAVKRCHDAMGSFGLTGGQREEYFKKIDSAKVNGNIGELEAIETELNGMREKLEQREKEARKPMKDQATNAEISLQEELAQEPPANNAELDKLRADIVKGLNSLSKAKVDRFDQPSRKTESMKKHLEVETLAECTDISKLKDYLEHLRDKYRNHVNAEKARKIIDALPEGHGKTQAEECYREAVVKGTGWDFIINTDWANLKEPEEK